MLLYRCIWCNIPDVFFICGMTNAVIQVYGGQYIRCRIIGLWNGDRCYIGIWGNIPDDEIFRLWNNECCYTDVYGAIYQMFFSSAE